MTHATDFLNAFAVEGGLLQISTGHPDNAKYYERAPTFSMPETGFAAGDVYFGPAARRTKGSYKTDVLGTRVLWVDVDNPVYPDCTLPPSAVVWSGHGFHLYWRLREEVHDLDRIEALNRILINDIPTSDPACWNANRLMRVPFTTNSGNAEEEPAAVELRHFTELTYHIRDIEAMAALDDLVRRRVRTGSQQGFRSRSERDWSVVKALVVAGMSDDAIRTVFAEQPIGDKVNDKGTSRQYLEHTIAKVREDVAANPPITVVGADGNPTHAKRGRRNGQAGAVPAAVIVEKDDGYYMVGQTNRRVSTFVLKPKVLLDGSDFGAKDAIVCDVLANGYAWENVTFSRGAFTSVGALDKECPVAAWQWIGHDSDVRLLLPHLLDKLRESGMARVQATPAMGYHVIKGVPLFVTDKQTIGPDDVWVGTEGPITWLPANKEHPKMSDVSEVNESELDTLRRFLPLLNEACPLWSMVGWYAASCLKPWLETQGLRFPVLNLAGTKGSGKTTLLQRVFMPLFGQADPRSYDAGTTRFVTLSLLGSSNAIPIAFSEFRYDSVEKFIRTILMAYDTGHDPRGRSDQTTVDYPLSAPFSVDGEDMVSDPAAQERIVLVRLRPDTIREGEEAYNAFQVLRENVPMGFGLRHISHALSAVANGHAHDLLEEARREIFAAIPQAIPDRVRNNYTVVLFGCKLFCEGVDLPPVDAAAFLPAIRDIVNLESGRSRTQVDDFVESIVNALGNFVPFKWQKSEDGREVYFHLAPAHNWWLRGRRQMGQGALMRDAIRTQLREATYTIPPRVAEGAVLYGISLPLAVKAGLDVPDHFGGLHVKGLE